LLAFRIYLYKYIKHFTVSQTNLKKKTRLFWAGSVCKLIFVYLHDRPNSIVLHLEILPRSTNARWCHEMFHIVINI
jgi:hypothetical protein